MPVARTYGAPKVETRAIPGARLQSAETNISTGAAFQQTKARAWGQVADTGLQVASAFGRLAQQEKDASDETALLKAEVDLGKWENQRLYDPEKGALGVQGQDALPLPETVGQEFDKVSGDIASTLSNDKQRAAFAKVRANHALNLDGTLRRHVDKEITEYRKGVLTAGVETAVSTAISNANDPRRVGQELQKATDTINSLGAKVGMSAPQREVAVRKAQTAIHSGVIERLLNNDNDKGARAYFEETKKQIDGEAIANIEKALDAGTLRGESQRASDKILLDGGSLTSQLAKVRAIEDPKLRDAVRERVEHEATVQDRIDRETKEATASSAFNMVDKSHDVATIPPMMWANFNGETKSALRSYAEHLAKGVPVQTDYQTFYALMDQAGKDPETFAKQPLLAYKAKLDDGNFERVANLQLSIRQGDRTAAQKELSGFQSRQEVVNNTLTQYGIETQPSKQSDAEKQAVAQLHRMIDQRVEAAQTTGKKVSNEELQGVVDALLSQKETVPGSVWAILRPFTYDFNDKTKRLIETAPGDIPADQRALIEESLRRNGRPVSDATVLNIYLEHKVRTNGR